MNRYLELLMNTPPRFYLHTAKYKRAKKTAAENYNEIKPSVFTLSTGRVGTETLARLFELDKKVIALHEPLPKLFGLSKTCYELTNNFSSVAQVEAALVEAFLTGRRDLLNYALYTSHGYIETGPHLTFAAPIILKVIPDARFIHMVRDPQSVVNSGILRKWYTGHINDQWRITPKLGDPFEPLWQNFNQVEKITWLWAETNRWILDFSRTLGKDRCLIIYSEDLFNANSEMILSMFTHLELATPPERKIRHILSKRLNAQKLGFDQKSVDWNHQIHPELVSFISRITDTLGYKNPVLS